MDAVGKLLHKSEQKKKKKIRVTKAFYSLQENKEIYEERKEREDVVNK